MMEAKVTIPLRVYLIRRGIVKKLARKHVPKPFVVYSPRYFQTLQKQGMCLGIIPLQEGYCPQATERLRYALLITHFFEQIQALLRQCICPGNVSFLEIHLPQEKASYCLRDFLPLFQSVPGPVHPIPPSLQAVL